MMTRTWQIIARSSINEGRDVRAEALQIIDELTAIIEMIPGTAADEAMALVDDLHILFSKEPVLGGRDGI